MMDGVPAVIRVDTPFTRRFGIDYPIVQGGLAHLAYAGLAAAVSNAGALGQITAASFATPEELRVEIARARALTSKPIAVNFALGRRDLADFLEVALDAGVRIISITAGNPEPFLRRIAGSEVLSIVLVAGVRQARKAEALGADAVIAVGQEGGGHIGRDDTGSIVLTPAIVDAVAIPVLASGGIADARGLAAALCLGASGIEMGTRFVSTVECVAHDAYKRAIVNATERDTVVIERTLGRPGRALDAPGARRILEVEAAGEGAGALLPLIAGSANRRAAHDGDLVEGFAWAGQSAALIHDVPSVRHLIERLVADASAILARASGSFASGPCRPT